MPGFSSASLEIFGSAYSQSDLFGKAIIVSLFLLSCAGWIVLGYKMWEAKKAKASALHTEQILKRHTDRFLAIDSEEIFLPFPKHVPQPFAGIYLDLRNKTLETLQKKRFFLEQDASIYLTPDDLSFLEQHTAIEISTQTKILEKHLFILSTIVTLAPFLGLLGTVWGILVTFSALQGGASAGSSSVILGGLSTALVTTVLGLLIAIPCLIAYNYLKNHLKSFVSDMEDFLSFLISTLELQYRIVRSE